MRSCNEYTYDEIQVGQKESFEVEITPAMENAFREWTGDVNPLHQDDGFAEEMGQGKFRSHVAFGMLTASFLSTLAGVYLPGKYSLIHSVEVGFVKPVYAGDRLTVLGECTDKQDALRLITLKVNIRSGANQTVLKGKMKVIVQK